MIRYNWLTRVGLSHDRPVSSLTGIRIQLALANLSLSATLNRVELIDEMVSLYPRRLFLLPRRHGGLMQPAQELVDNGV